MLRHSISYKHWYIGRYSTKDLSDSHLKVVSLVDSEDGDGKVGISREEQQATVEDAVVLVCV